MEELLGTSYHHQETCNISWSALRKAIDQTKFEGCDFALVLQYYFQETIISRKEHRTRKEDAFQTFLADIILSHKQEQGAQWLSELLQKKGVVYQRIRQQYEQDQSIVNQQLLWVMQALAQLPAWSKKTANLAIFASQITGDPHTFDYGKFPAYLLLQGIRFLLQPSNPCNSQMDKNELLVQAGLYKDSISNYCMLFHLLAFDHTDHIHPGWQGFYDHHEIWNVNCSNLDAIHCMDVSSTQVVIIIENPSVFQTLSTFVTTHQFTSFGFVCSRNKKDVLKELPDEIEEVRKIEFSEEEQKLYLANVAEVNQELNMMEDAKNNKLQILAMLTKLRQICCEPRLVYENIDHMSSKLVACLELIEELHENHQKVLLFSTFTSILDLLAEELKRKQISFYQLTGKTNKEQRKDLVQKFQQDDTYVFLISLKAGGTGLNLTAAEAVIHFDPWWNQSAQNQATDHAYRIGQGKKVQVFKFIMKDSIEEKIQKLQEQKKELA